MQLSKTIISDVYCKQWNRLQKELAIQRSALTNEKLIILQQYNTISNTAR